MVLGVVMIATMLPTMIGLNEATSGTRDQEENRRTSARKQRCHLVATCGLEQGSQHQREQIHNAKVYVGAGGKVSFVVTHSGLQLRPQGGKQTNKERANDDDSIIYSCTSLNLRSRK